MKIGYAVLLLVFSIIITAEITGIGLLYQYKNTIEDNIIKNSEKLNSIMVNRIDSYATERLVDVINFAGDTTFESAIESSNVQFSKMNNTEQYINKINSEWTAAPTDAITPFMKTIIDSQPSIHLREISNSEDKLFNGNVYGEISITNAYGANVVETNKTSDYRQNEETWWQEARKNGVYVGNIEFDNSSKNISFPVATRIDDSNGNFLGVVKAVANVEQIINIIKTQMSIAGVKPSEYELVNGDGMILYSSGMNEKQFTPNIESAYKNQMNDQFGYFTYSDPKSGENYLVTYSHSQSIKISPLFNWVFITKYKSSELLEPVITLSEYMMMIIFTTIIGVSIATITLSHKILKPINNIQEEMQNYSNGKIVELKPEGTNELKSLVETFNSMTTTIKKSEEALFASEEKYRAFFEESPLAIQVHDENENIIATNNIFLNLFGFQKEEIIGKSFSTIVADDSIIKEHHTIHSNEKL